MHCVGEEVFIILGYIKYLRTIISWDDNPFALICTVDVGSDRGHQHPRAQALLANSVLTRNIVKCNPPESLHLKCQVRKEDLLVQTARFLFHQTTNYCTVLSTSIRH